MAASRTPDRRRARARADVEPKDPRLKADDRPPDVDKRFVDKRSINKRSVGKRFRPPTRIRRCATPSTPAPMRRRTKPPAR
jgi:hypothetical protein